VHNEIRLPGCRPDPIASYLSALGVIRIISEQVDKQARCRWQTNEFNLLTSLSKNELIEFFTEEYEPTPIITPWSGGSGFFPKDNKRNIEAIESSDTPRLQPYRQVIAIAKSILAERGITKKPSNKQEKFKLLCACRASFPEQAIDWLDAAFTLTEEDVSYFPLLGTGGNDCRLDFGQNFMINITKLLLSDEAQNQNRSWLKSALFESEESALCYAPIGQFHPGGVGGPNAITGFEGTSLVNPWTYVLMLEGATAWAGAVSRRMGIDSRGKASFPFTVTASTAGCPTLANVDERTARAEIWLPIWVQYASFSEISNVLAEGRATVGRRQARNAVDFALAASQLGVDRGIYAFQRYVFVKRSGKAHLASPIGSITVQERPESSLVNEAVPWINRLRKLAFSKEGSASLRTAVRRIDDAVIDYCSLGECRRLVRVMASLGRAERVLARRASSKLNEKIQPLNHLSPGWLRASYDGSREFRLAAAAASVFDEDIGGIRLQLEPIEIRKGKLTWSSRSSASTILAGSNLPEALSNVLSRRLVFANEERVKQTPAAGLISANLADVYSFIYGNVDFGILSDLFWAMSTIKWEGYSPGKDWRPGTTQIPADMPQSYAVMKLVFSPKPLEWPPGAEETIVRFESEILRRLGSENITGATQVAVRRLRASGLDPLLPADRFADQQHVFPTSEARGRMLAAALLFPISKASIAWLCREVLSFTGNDR
jgi:CRISPR-associated protein Csx17